MTAAVVPWGPFAAAEPALAEAGRALLYQFGVGLAFLATVRPDGGPRVHPICPLLSDAGLFAFLIPSPKRNDLERDGRYALHSFPADKNEDAFCLTGVARPAGEPGLRAALETQFLLERSLAAAPEGFDRQRLFVFEIERCLYTRTTGHGDPHPHHTIWRASSIH